MLILTVPMLPAATSCAPRTERRVAEVADDPLQAGWSFACGITNDADDRAECQEKIALAYLERGDSEKGLTLGGRIENWRKGVVLAEAATRLAQAGRTEEARRWVIEAEVIGRNIQDWQRDRILARVAKTKALLGQEDEVGRWSAFYRSNLDYRGELAAYHALALARAGDMTNALTALGDLDDSTHIDVSSWQAHGYLLLARAGYLNGEKLTQALTKAWAAAARVPGNKRPDVQWGLIMDAAALGAREQALAWMEEASPVWQAWQAPAHLRVPVLARLAIAWGALGRTENVVECAREVESLIHQLQAIEQPAVFAMLGEAWARMGDTQKALRCYEHAFEVTGQLINPRPRAIACVDICLSLERAGLRHRTVSEGLNRLLAGFGAPHG